MKIQGMSGSQDQKESKTASTVTIFRTKTPQRKSATETYANANSLLQRTLTQ